VKQSAALLTAVLLTACLRRAAASPAKIPIILDTGIGTDIDDAFALALIIDSPEFDLLGVTTVSTGHRLQVTGDRLPQAEVR